MHEYDNQDNGQSNGQHLDKSRGKKKKEKEGQMIKKKKGSR